VERKSEGGTDHCTCTGFLEHLSITYSTCTGFLAQFCMDREELRGREKREGRKRKSEGGVNECTCTGFLEYL
jgi:hypothetical protein